MNSENVVFEDEALNKNPKPFKRVLIKFILGILVMAVFLVVLVILLKRIKKDERFYEANYSEYQIYCESKAYIVNNETLIDFKNDSTIVTLAKSNKRIAVGDVIAMYKTAEYDNNLVKLAEMDKKINEKISALKTPYSAEIVQVENNIDSIIQKIKNTSSYIEINEYKTKLNDLAYKKARIVASLSPSGEEVLKLINERDAFYKKINTSLQNIKSNKAGVVVYKTDGLEGKYKIDGINKEKIEEIKKLNSEPLKEVFGIKIVDNFENYIIVEDSKDNQKYMKEGNNYSIELIDKDCTIKGELYKIIDGSDNKVYCILKITNGIENIVDLRTTSVKVIWKNYKGFIINNASMTKNGEINYVKIFTMNEYKDIPVKIVLTINDKSLVSNYTNQELEDLKIEKVRNLRLYDRVVKDIALLENK